MGMLDGGGEDGYGWGRGYGQGEGYIKGDGLGDVDAYVFGDIIYCGVINGAGHGDGTGDG